MSHCMAGPRKQTIFRVLCGNNTRALVRVYLHAIDATPADGVAMPVPRRSTELDGRVIAEK